MSGRAILATAGVGGSTLLLLRRMGREFGSSGALRVSTMAAMYATYAGHAALTAHAVHRRTLPLPLPDRLAGACGAALVVAGAGTCAAGMQRFSGPRQISGTEIGELTTSGVYRWSRNPQYAGYVALLTGVGLARRSGAALGLAGAMAGAFRYWVPIEERHLDRDLGEPYRRYRERTGRWMSLG